MKEDTTPIDSTWLLHTGGYAKDMTLRDYYTGLAMQVLLFHNGYNYKELPDIADHAEQMAHAMIENWGHI